MVSELDMEDASSDQPNQVAVMDAMDVTDQANLADVTGATDLDMQVLGQADDVS